MNPAKLSILFVIVFSAMSCGAGDKIKAKDVPGDIITNQTAYIMGLRQPDGAILLDGQQETDSSYKIMPYSANIAALALLEVPTADHVAAVKQWMLWYFRKMDPKDSFAVNDYYENAPGDTTQKNMTQYDSMDAYSATMLSLAKRLGEQSPGDIAWLQHNRVNLEHVAANLLTCFQPGNGLTWDKPQHTICYTQDNAEVHQALVDVQWLVGHQLLNAGDWKAKLKSQAAAFELLWNKQNNNYDWALDNASVDYSQFYPVGTAQFTPIVYHVFDSQSARAVAQWQLFNTQYKNWSTNGITASDGTPWSTQAYTAIVMKDDQRALAYLGWYKKYLDANPGTQVPYWDCNMAGMLLLTASAEERRQRKNK